MDKSPTLLVVNMHMTRSRWHCAATVAMAHWSFTVDGKQRQIFRFTGGRGIR